MFAVILALMLAAAACSSSDDSGNDADEVAAPATTAEEGNGGGNGDGVADEGDDSDEEPEDDTDVDLGDLGVLSDSECLQTARIVAAAFSGGVGQLGEPDEFLSAFDDLAAAAPSDIADDLNYIFDSLTELYDVLEDAGVDFNDPNTFTDPEVAQALVEAGEALDNEAFDSAAENVEAWFNENCEVGG